MAWSKTFAASSIKSSLSALGNVTVKISEATEFTYDDNYGDNGEGFPIGSELNIEVTRSSSTNVGNEGVAIRLFICDTATYDLHYIYWIYEATFHSTLKTAELYRMSVSFFEWSDLFSWDGTNSKSYFYMIATDDTMTYWTGLGACFTFNYAQNPAFDIAEFVEDNGDVPSGWANELFQSLSKPRFDIHMLDVKPHNSGQGNNAQPYGISLAGASGTFCGSTAVAQSASGTVAYDDVIDPTYELQFGYITNATGTGTVTANSTRQTSNQLALTSPKTIRSYNAPEVVSLDTYRCDSSGVAVDDGTHVKVEFQVRCWGSNDTQSTATATIKVYEGTDPDFTQDTPVDTATTTVLLFGLIDAQWAQYTNSVSLVLGEEAVLSAQSVGDDSDDGLIEIEKAYTVQVTIADAVRSTVMSDILPQAFFTMDFLAGGRGVAIGKPATVAGLLDVGMDLNVDGSVYLDGGKVIAKSTVIDESEAAPLSPQYYRSHETHDANGNVIGYLESTRSPGDATGFGICTTRTVNSSPIYNSIWSYIDAQGNCSYYVADKPKFREAINAIASAGEVKTGSNLNNMPWGAVWWGNSFLNAPDSATSSTLWYRVISFDGIQMAFLFTSNTSSPNMYIRSYVNSVWQPWRRCDNEPCLQLSGGTMTGSIRLRTESYSANTTAPSSTVDQDLLTVYDKDGRRLWVINYWHEASSNKLHFRLWAQRYINSTTYYNMLDLSIDGSGNRYVSVSDASAWRSAIGANSATNLTTGTLPVARINYSSKSFTSSKTYNPVEFYKFGRVCWCHYNGFKSLAQNNNTVVSSIDAAYRPSREVYATGIASGSTNQYRIAISSAGVVSVYSYNTPTGSQNNFCGEMVYFTAS